MREIFMKVDGEKVLYQKIGVTIRELALSLLSKNVGERIQSISRYQEEFQVSRGTIQNAICYLKEVRAVELVSCGHLGTFIEKIDYGHEPTGFTKSGIPSKRQGRY